MALTKTQNSEITGIIEPYRILKIRVTTEILEDGEQISKGKTEDTLYPKYSRYCKFDLDKRN